MNSRTLLTGSPALALAAAALLAACGGNDAQPAGGESARQIELAPAPAAQPQLNDAPEQKAAPSPKATSPREKQAAPAPKQVAETPAPPPSAVAAPAPAAAPAVREGPAPTPTGTVAVGTSFSVHPAVRVCTSTHKAGDRFTATLDSAVEGSNGATIPGGSTVVLRVVESARSEDSKDNAKLTFDVVAVKLGDESYEVIGRVTQGAEMEKVRAQSTGQQAKKIGAGAAIGAIAGRILGKDTRATVTGAVVGAAAGAAVAAGTADYDACVASKGGMTITLERALRVRVRS